MNLVTRGIRNAFRNAVRTLSIVIILGLSIGLALCMIIARQAVSDKIANVKSSVGTTITVSPAGSQGFEGGGNPLTNDQVKTVASITNVSSVLATLRDRLTSSDTNLVSSIDAGSLGRRNAGSSGVGFQFAGRLRGDPNSDGSVMRTFTPPVEVTGTNSLALASVYGGNKVTYTSGAALDPTKDADVAVVGKNLATKNNLSVGSTFTAYSTSIKVVGIYDTGTEFSNNGVIMALPTVQRLSSQTNDVTAMTATVNSIDNVSSVAGAIKGKLGSAADVVSDQQTTQAAVVPLENVKTIATYSLMAALIAGAVIILLTMVMIVRERRREIGVVKAIGSSNLATMIQFMVESMTLTLIGLIVGLIIAVAASSPITNALVQTSSSNSSSLGQQARPAGGSRGFGTNLTGGITNARRSLKSIKTPLGWSLIGEGVIAALVIAIVGSAVPAYFISRVRPSEVMRAE